MNLVEGLLEETLRVTEIKGYYDAEPNGVFGSAMIQQSIDKAKEAMATGDVVTMLASCKELKEIE